MYHLTGLKGTRTRNLKQKNSRLIFISLLNPALLWTTTTKSAKPVTTSSNVNNVNVFPPPKEQSLCMNKNGQTWTLLQCDYPKHEVIGLDSIQLGYLPGEHCLGNTNFSVGCQQDHSPLMYTQDLQTMSGRLPKKRNLALQMAFGVCNNGQTRTVGDYTVLKYDCIDDTSITTMCGKSSRTSDILYVSSHGYPEYGSPDGNCSCVIKSTSNHIFVQTYDNRISSGQMLKLTKEDGTVLKYWTYDAKFNHRQTDEVVAENNTLYLQWEAGNITSENGQGKFWIRLRALAKTPAIDASDLTIDCSERHSSKPFKIERTEELLSHEKYARQCKEQYSNSFLNPECNGNQVIGLHHIKLGYLLNGTTCKTTGVLDSCEEDHTKYQYLGGAANDITDKGDLGKMSGRQTNQYPMSIVGVSGECIPIGDHGNIISRHADYISASYDCINRDDITTMCESGHMSGTTLYVWNYGYPDSGDILERSCHCTINSTATKFIVQTYDNRIDHSQQLDLSYGNETVMMRWHGDDNFNHIDTKTVDIKRGEPLTLNWKSPNGTGSITREKRGLFWIRIKATDTAKMAIKCFEPIWPTMTTPTTSLIGERLSSAVTIQCDEFGWDVRVDMGIIQTLYPSAVASDIYLGENRCTGVLTNNVLIFQQGLRQCLTSEIVRDGTLVYSNEIIYAQHDPAHPFLISKYPWTVPIECDIVRKETSSVIMHHLGHSVVTAPTVVSQNHYPVNITFYQDPNFLHMMNGNLLHVTVGSKIYVKIFTKSPDWTIKMKVASCYTKPNQTAPDSTKYYIIKNGCEVDSNTHFLSQSFHETKFVFQDFEYNSNHEGIYLFCETTYCKSSDSSSTCQQTCINVVRRSVKLP